MPRYFFDIHDGQFTRDDEGIECEDFAAARREAMASLPEMVRFVLPQDSDAHASTVLVRNQAGTIVYTATLTFAGFTLNCEATT